MYSIFSEIFIKSHHLMEVEMQTQYNVVDDINIDSVHSTNSFFFNFIVNVTEIIHSLFIVRSKFEYIVQMSTHNGKDEMREIRTFCRHFISFWYCHTLYNWKENSASKMIKCLLQHSSDIWWNCASCHLLQVNCIGGTRKSQKKNRQQTTANVHKTFPGRRLVVNRASWWFFFRLCQIAVSNGVKRTPNELRPEKNENQLGFFFAQANVRLWPVMKWQTHPLWLFFFCTTMKSK